MERDILCALCGSVVNLQVIWCIMSGKFYTGWAMDAYPEMDEAAMAHHVERQFKLGANFFWIGHNNPGEVDAQKIEPGLSYAVYEAFMDKSDPRHKDAVQILAAQRRLLDYCLRHNVHVVFPIGYQIQMGERWNAVHPESLRRHFDGTVVDYGGVSACSYSPQYQKDIRQYYEWVAETFIKDYRPIILLVNLADEPFGANYSRWAEQVFKERTGLTFAQALNSGDEEKCLLGDFQSNYVVHYAAWSARVWHEVCPDIPSTMSFCGHHAREENLLPSVVGLFAETPEYFHPTFDVYPRDGDQKTSIKESDVVMLIILLRQLGYLSAKYRKPYWLWTTGNSWGLGQGSSDKANIADAIVNQLMALEFALENGGHLSGFAIWNYNVKCQGLYNDIYETVYDIEDMFKKLTRVIGILRDLPMRNVRRDTEIVIVTERDYAAKYIAESRATTLVRPFPFARFIHAAKNNLNLFMDESLADVIDYCDESKIAYPSMLIYLSSGEIAPSQEEHAALLKYLSGKRRALIPRRLLSYLKNSEPFPAEIFLYDETPEHISEETLTAFTNNDRSGADGLFHFNLGEVKVAYNLTGVKRPLVLRPEHKNMIVTQLDPFANMKERHKIGAPNSVEVMLEHHEVAFISKPNSLTLKRLMDTLAKT